MLRRWKSILLATPWPKKSCLESKKGESREKGESEHNLAIRCLSRAEGEPLWHLLVSAGSLVEFRVDERASEGWFLCCTSAVRRWIVGMADSLGPT